MRIEKARLLGQGSPAALRISRRDFLKMGGAGLAGAGLISTLGCGVLHREGS